MSYIIQERDDATGEWSIVNEIPYHIGTGTKPTFGLTREQAKVEAVAKAKKRFFDGLKDMRVREGDKTIWKDGRWIDHDEIINPQLSAFEGFDAGLG